MSAGLNATEISYNALANNISTYDNMIQNCTSCGLDITTTTEFTLPEPPYSPWATGLLALIAGLTSLCTTVGNILVVAAFILEKNLRQPSNYLIASLAATDILIGMFSMPFYSLYLLMDYWPLGQMLCDLWLSLDYTVCLVSQYTVFLITLDRFFSVKAPAKYRNWRTTRKIKIMIAITWLVPTLIFFTSILGWRRFTGIPAPTDFSCYADFQNDPLFTVILVISYYWVTLIIMTGLYIGIYQVALSLHTKARAKRNRMKRVTKLSTQNDNDTEPLNQPTALTNGNANRNVARNNASQLREDSECSYEPSSDSTSSRKVDNSIPGTVITDTTTTSAPQMLPTMESPIWKPRESLPTASINWDAFNDGTYSTLQCTESNIDGSSDVIKEETVVNGEIKVIEEDSSSSNNRILAEVTKIFTQISKAKWCKRNIKQSSPKTKSKSENRAIKALRTITFILGAFVLCWTPYHIVIIIQSYCNNCVNNKFFDFTYWLCYMNSPLNPFCYALSNQQFKKTFLKILKGEYFRGRRRY